MNVAIIGSDSFEIHNKNLFKNHLHLMGVHYFLSKVRYNAGRKDPHFIHSSYILNLSLGWTFNRQNKLTSQSIPFLLSSSLLRKNESQITGMYVSSISSYF
jgi:hypothetical protein